ncbi:MAG: phosphotransferase [Acidimicrobiales bacterium]
MSTTPDLRTEPDDIDPVWMSAVLAAAGTPRPVGSLRHEPVGVGLMARSHRFTLDHTDGSTSTVVVKFPSSDLGTRSLGASAYAREVGFYLDVAATINGGLARCLHAASNDDGSDFVLVLEDLAPRRPGDQLLGCDVAAAETAVANMARLHGSTWHRDAIAELTWTSQGTGSGLADIMGVVLGAFAERFAGLLDEATLPVLACFAERIEVWLEREPSTRALVHGDYRLDNLLFGDDDVVAVDWQTVDYRSPMRDLAYFCGNSLTVETRRDVEKDLLDHYLEVLATEGVNGFDAARAHDEMLHGMFQGPMVTMLGAFTASRSERSEAMFAAMADRAASQILDHDALDVLS